MKSARDRILNAVTWMPFLLAVAGTAIAQEDPTHDELRALNARVVEAFNRRDVDAILAEAHENVVFTTMNSDVARGRDGIREYFEKMMVGPDRVVEDVNITFEADELTALYEGDTGIATGDSVGHFKLVSGLTFDVTARWTATLVKENDVWQVAGFHYSANIFDNPIMDDITKTYQAICIGAALLTLILGLFLGRRFSKRK
ncbi:YybH family protein [Pseudomonadota bacterium]